MSILSVLMTSPRGQQRPMYSATDPSRGGAECWAKCNLLARHFNCLKRDFCRWRSASRRKRIAQLLCSQLPLGHLLASSFWDLRISLSCRSVVWARVGWTSRSLPLPPKRREPFIPLCQPVIYRLKQNKRKEKKWKKTKADAHVLMSSNKETN